MEKKYKVQYHNGKYLVTYKDGTLICVRHTAQEAVHIVNGLNLVSDIRLQYELRRSVYS